MKEFKLKVVHQIRALFGFLATMMTTMLWLGQSHGIYSTGVRLSVAAMVLFVASYIFLYLFSFGRVSVIAENGKLKFNWQKKALLDYGSYQDVEISEISKIKVDTNPQGKTTQLTIYSESNKITLANFESFKLLKDDLSSFIWFLETAHLKEFSEQPISTTDSWSEFRKKGYSKLIAYGYLALSIIFVELLIAATVKNGFKVQYMAWLLMVIPQFVLWWSQYKLKGNS